MAIIGVKFGEKRRLCLSVFTISKARYEIRQLMRVAAPLVVAALATEKVVKVAVGDYQTVLSTEKGEVYTCGFGYCGLLGHGTLGYVPVTEYRKDFERGHDGSFWERYQVTPGLHCPRAITTLE